MNLKRCHVAIRFLGLLSISLYLCCPATAQAGETDRRVKEKSGTSTRSAGERDIRQRGRLRTQESLTDAVKAAQIYMKQRKSAGDAVRMLKTEQKVSAEVAAEAMIRAGYTVEQSSPAMQAEYGRGSDGLLMKMAMQVAAELSRREAQAARERAMEGGEAKVESKQEAVERREEEAQNEREGSADAAMIAAEALRNGGASLGETWEALTEQFGNLSEPDIMEILFSVFRESIGETNADRAFWIQKLTELSADGLLALFLKLNIIDPNDSTQTHVVLAEMAAEIKKTAGWTANQVGDWIRVTFSSTWEEIADILAKIGYTAPEVAQWLKDNARWRADQVADWIKGTFSRTWEEVADILADVGFEAEKVMQWLKDTAGRTPTQLATWVREKYDAMGGAVAKWLRALGYSATESASALEAAYGASADQVAGWMNEAGFSIGDIAGVLIEKFGLNVAQATQLLLGLNFELNDINEAITSNL